MWEVRAIHGQRGKGKSLQHHVEWETGERTWEPPCCFPCEARTAFARLAPCASLACDVTPACEPHARLSRPPVLAARRSMHAPHARSYELARARRRAERHGVGSGVSTCRETPRMHTPTENAAARPARARPPRATPTRHAWATGTAHGPRPRCDAPFPRDGRSTAYVKGRSVACAHICYILTSITYDTQHTYLYGRYGR